MAYLPAYIYIYPHGQILGKYDLHGVFGSQTLLPLEQDLLMTWNLALGAGWGYWFGHCAKLV